MRRIEARVIAMLIATVLLGTLVPGVEAQGGFGRGRSGQGGGRGRPAEPGPREELAPAEYSFDLDQVLR